jgi:rSAM/selenodomain-associated transferase 1
MRRRPTLVVFVKAPRLGAVKTRLAAGIGAPAALRFYRGCLSRLLRGAGRDRRWRTCLAVTPDRCVAQGLGTAAGFARQPQGRGDLGRRMARALAAHGPGPVLIVGSDVPGLAPRHIARAFALLRAGDMVFGPADDGGYWCVGARGRRRPPGLFRRVRWSSRHALADTLAGLPAGLRIAFADRLEDVDDLRSWRRWRDRDLEPAAEGAREDRQNSKRTPPTIEW